MDNGTSGNRGPASIAQSRHMRLGYFLLLGLKKWVNMDVVPLLPQIPNPTLSVSKVFWESSPVWNSPPMKWDDELLGRGEDFQKVMRDSWGWRPCMEAEPDCPGMWWPPEVFYMLSIDSKIGSSAAGLGHTGKAAGYLRTWAKEWLKSWTLGSRKDTEGRCYGIKKIQVSENEVPVESQSRKSKNWTVVRAYWSFRFQRKPHANDGQTQEWLIEGVAEGDIASHETTGCEVGDCCPALKSSKKIMKRGRKSVGSNWIEGASKEVTLILAPAPSTTLPSKGVPWLQRSQCSKVWMTQTGRSLSSVPEHRARLFHLYMKVSPEKV